MNHDNNIHDNATPDGFPDELISAYLDGELSPAEKLRVEEQLMDSAAHRQLFDELKSLRHSLQALPQASLDRDFASRVLNRAEQQLLTEEVEPASDAPAPLAASPSTYSATRSETWRGLIWSVAAIAAAVMLIVLGPLYTQRENNRPVVINEPATESGEAKREDQQTSAEAAKEVAELHDGIRDGERASQTSLAEDRAEVSLRGRDLKPQASDDIQPSAPPAAPLAMELDSAIAESGSAQRDAHAKKYDAQNGALPSALSAPGAAAPNRNVIAANEFQQQGPQYEYADMMVVSVDVTPEALSRHFMDELLQKHEIQTELARADIADELAGAKENKDAQDRADNKALEKSEQLADKQQLAQADAAEGEGALDNTFARRAQREEVAQRQRFAEQEEEKLVKASSDVDIVVVVATQQQIQQLLGDMQSQQGDVLAMAYDRPIALADRKNRQATDSLARAISGKSFVEDADSDVAADGLAAALGAPETTGANAIAGGARSVPPTPREGLGASPGATAFAPSNRLKQKEFANQAARPAYRADALPAQDAEDFRGIARRLHLPEDFQKLLVQPQPQVRQGVSEAALADAAPPMRETQGEAGGDGPSADDAVEPLNAKKAADAAKGDGKEPLMRVLFVLRAASRTPQAPLADQLPAEISPANAALQQPTTRSADEAGAVDE